MTFESYVTRYIFPFFFSPKISKPGDNEIRKALLKKEIKSKIIRGGTEEQMLLSSKGLTEILCFFRGTTT